ncbi:hypothetical protein NM688_g1736 [Phlebia brevispora]|uniref:Uncharacterized protein n=1 Tax=Phlebia brevispora TaxID=194682 RepID=A0ACC1TAN6_9APHY|nr:hypothetical protein NM688_g1736 [Phlebia brevispora]
MKLLTPFDLHRHNLFLPESEPMFLYPASHTASLSDSIQVIGHQLGQLSHYLDFTQLTLDGAKADWATDKLLEAMPWDVVLLPQELLDLHLDHAVCYRFSLPQLAYMPSSSGTDKSTELSALTLGPRRRARASGPWVHFGRGVGRQIHAFPNIQRLLKRGIEGMSKLAEIENGTADDLPSPLCSEYKVFEEILAHIPNFVETICAASADDVKQIAQQIQAGINGARSDNTKGLKAAILRWIRPPGKLLQPEIRDNDKQGRGFNHDVTGALLCPAGWDWNDPDVKQQIRNYERVVDGTMWPVLLYRDGQYDSSDPWKGFLRNELLVKSGKRIFTSPSSAEQEVKATRSGNARLHGMTSMTPAAIAYVATQVRFALSSSSIFNRNDIVTDSERFYNSVREFLLDPTEAEEVKTLLQWWNECLFPGTDKPKSNAPQDASLAINAFKMKRQARPPTLRAESGDGSRIEPTRGVE